MQAPRKYFVTLLSVPVLAVLLAAFAQDHDGNASAVVPGRQSRGMMPSTDDRLEHLSRILSLTDEQKTKIRPMLDDEADRMQLVWQDGSTSRDGKRQKLQQIHNETTAEIKTALSSDQQKKLPDMKALTKPSMAVGATEGGNKPQ